MIYIRKRKTPNIIAEKATAIKKDLASGYEKLELPRDSTQLRFLFEQMPKAMIRSELIKEQHGLCAYCMRGITGQQNDTKIEHYKALSVDKEGALDYQNYLGVCYGGEHDSPEQNKQCLCCDASRGDKELTISPWNQRQMQAIGYYKNGEKDSNGKIEWDTRSKLVASRRCICDSVHSQFDRWSKKGFLTAEYLQEKIEKLESQLKDDNIADEYIGVRLYLYKRKKEKLEKQK